MDEMIRKLPPDVRAAIDSVAAQERASREALAKNGTAKAGEAIADTSRTLPFSMRLSGAERERLAQAASAQGVTKTDLARQLIIDGLARLEAKQQSNVDPEQARIVVGEIIDLLDRTGIVDRLRQRDTGT